MLDLELMKLENENQLHMENFSVPPTIVPLIQITSLNVCARVKNVKDMYENL